MKNKSNHNSQKVAVASNKKQRDWRIVKMKVYYVYDKATGKVWTSSTDREGRDVDYRECREAYPEAKLGKFNVTVMAKDLFKKINVNKIKEARKNTHNKA